MLALSCPMSHGKDNRIDEHTLYLAKDSLSILVGDESARCQTQHVSDFVRSSAGCHHLVLGVDGLSLECRGRAWWWQIQS